MTAALKPSGYPRRQHRANAPRSHSSGSQAFVAPIPQAPPPKLRHRAEAVPVVREFPAPPPQPRWLKSLVLVQQASSLLSIGLIGTLLATYGWSVMTQQRWSQAFDRWEILQKQEQQLLTSNELLKNELSKEAEQTDSGLINATTESMLYVPKATARPLAEPEEIPDVEPIPVKPLGY
jgi:hypothetical protein